MSPRARNAAGRSGEWIAGVDEAGRGPLAGPVVAAAVVLPAGRCIAGLADSKRLHPAQRALVFARVQQLAVAWGIGRAEVEEIDRLNILQATLLAMRRAVAGLRGPLGRVFVDGNRPPLLDCPVTCVVRGDQLVPVISAASIMAKVSRDRELERLEVRFPGYGLAVHKGYPTRAHLEALRRLGPSPVHRRSFRPVREAEECAAEPVEAERRWDR